MNSTEICFEVYNNLENVLDLGYNQLYINVDDLFNGNGFLRLLAMKEMENIIVFDGIFPLHICYEVLDIINESEYDIKDFTIRSDD